MDKETINLIMNFMMRVNLNGSEVPAFNVAMNALHDAAQELEGNVSHEENGKERHS